MIAALQNWMERSYRLTPAPPAGKFFIDSGELRHWIGPQHPLAHSDEVVLLIRREQEVRIGLYFKDAARNSSSLSFHQICTLIEGVSHVLLLLDRCHSGQEVTQLELELQAEVDKFLFFRLSFSDQFRSRARHHLDTEVNLNGLDSERKKTYETARKLANRYCRHLEATYLGSRSHGPLWEELRRFYRMTHWQKLNLLGTP